MSVLIMRGEEAPLETIDVNIFIGERFISVTLSMMCTTSSDEAERVFAHTYVSDREPDLPDFSELIANAIRALKVALADVGGVLVESEVE